VKSLVPFPTVLATLNNNLPWLQQIGYSFATQQADVFASIPLHLWLCDRQRHGDGSPSEQQESGFRA
jgi:hypothetical protein